VLCFKKEQAMVTERQFDTGTVTLNYAEGSTDGPPLVLVHGLSYRWQSWLPVMPTLALRWHLFAPDLRGFGRSGRVPGAYRVVDYAADITAFLRGVGQPAVLVGHSLGAIVALATAADAPDLVRALVLEEPPLSLFTGQSVREMPVYEPYRRLRDLALRQPSLEETVAVLGRAMPDADAVEVRSRAVALLQRDPEALTFILEDRAGEGLTLDRRLSGITCPVLCIQGNPQLGSAFGDQQAEWLASLLPQCTRITFPNAGHFIHRSLPADIARLVVDFLETIDP
jgi:pimeloyl-ACP methyl ester carboxylesterase